MVVLEKTLKSPLDCKMIQPVHPKVNQSWIFTGRTDAEAETPILGLPDVKNWLIWKDPDVGKDWGREEKWMAKDERAGWHHWLYGHEFEYLPGVGDGQGCLECCSLRGCKELDMTEWLNWTELINQGIIFVNMRLSIYNFMLKRISIIHIKIFVNSIYSHVYGLLVKMYF